MKAAFKKWGNSASIRIPTAILQAANLSLDEPVDIREESGRIVFDLVRPQVYDLGELLKGITRANLHHEVDSGEQISKETGSSKPLLFALGAKG